MFGSTEIIVIALIIFILFGARAIPRFAKSLGEARKEFQKSVSTPEDHKKDDTSEDSSETSA